MRMEPQQQQHCMFETSHVLGALLASSPLLMQSWSYCQRANVGSSSFVAESFQDTVYAAFSGTQIVECNSVTGNEFFGSFFSSIPVESIDCEVFSPLLRVVGDEDNEKPVLVQAGAVHLFQALCKTTEFKMLISEIKNKRVIFTGHSIGGSLASMVALYCLCLSCHDTSLAPESLLCITFGSPLLGNEALSTAIARERWSGKFCHVVAQYDIVPRLLFCPLSSMSPQFMMLLSSLIQSMQFAMKYPQFASPTLHLSDEQKDEIHAYISMHVNTTASTEKLSTLPSQTSLYRPFGNYALCSTEGAVCIDEPQVVMKILYLTFVAGSLSFSFEEEHLSYGNLVVKLANNLLLKKKIPVEEESPTSNYSTGVLLALKASGINIQDMEAVEAKECFETSMRIGGRPNLICASLSVKLAKVTPCRAQIEWYKALCDYDMGYYDCFKLRKTPKKDAKVNINRIKLAQFWNSLIDMLQNNELPHDFHKRSKWVNAAHFYKLLVEPLDIAEYYRLKLHKKKGHYLTLGRERRYKIFDRWWTEGKKELLGKTTWKRSKFAGLTQDSCFWAKVEEAKEWLENALNETENRISEKLWENLKGFEQYAEQLIERKEVSTDVLAPKSSYSLWEQQWKNLKLQLSAQNIS